MSEARRASADVVEQLRRDFDATFVRPNSSEIVETERIIIVGLAGDPYAIRMAQIRELHADHRIIPLPSSIPQLLGVASFRGQIAPVYDLTALLNYPRREAPRWLVLARADQSLALAFDSFQVQLSVLPHEMVLSEDSPRGEAIRPHLRGALVAQGAPNCPILHLPSVLEDIKQRVAATQSKPER